MPYLLISTQIRLVSPSLESVPEFQHDWFLYLISRKRALPRVETRKAIRSSWLTSMRNWRRKPAIHSERWRICRRRTLRSCYNSPLSVVKFTSQWTHHAKCLINSRCWGTNWRARAVLAKLVFGLCIKRPSKLFYLLPLSSINKSIKNEMCKRDGLALLFISKYSLFLFQFTNTQENRVSISWLLTAF